MSCNTVCKLCDNLIISQSVTFADGNVVINLPAGSYYNNHKYCIVIAQAIPAEATIYAPVVVTIGEGTVQYPLTRRNCSQVTVCGIRTRTRYSTCLVTDATGGTFRMLGQPACCPPNQLEFVDGTAPTAAAADSSASGASSGSGTAKSST